MDTDPTLAYRITRWQFLKARVSTNLRHLLPRTHWTAYGVDGEERICIWKQWGNRCYQVLDFTTGKPFSFYE